MSIDTYGLSSEQYIEFFHKNVRLAAKLYLDTCNILNEEGVGNIDFKTVLDMYQEAVYTTNDDCRRYQKGNNPDVLKELDSYELVPSQLEIIEQINGLTKYIEGLVAINGWIAPLPGFDSIRFDGIVEEIDKTKD